MFAFGLQVPSVWQILANNLGLRPVFVTSRRINPSF